MTLTAADLFCGAGGFTEGFREAGFRVTDAVDLWPPAIVTHKKNHPDTAFFMADLMTFPPRKLGSVDVLIGSPPCTEFSFANRGGSGNVEQGMRLVYRFLRFVYELRPRFWVMENVPRVLDFLPDEIPLRKLGIDKRGALEIPMKRVLTAADYGAPQSRRRAFSGDFPLPIPSHSEFPTPRTRSWLTLRRVIEGLPDPTGAPRGDVVRDPIYGFDVPISDLTDHFAPDLLLSAEETRENRKAKEGHSWYGLMSFPDELDRPARTVMATNLRVARETIIVPARAGRSRRLSIREAACVQGFPITYQWWGANSSIRYKLVGNAVAPPLAFAIAKAILGVSEARSPERPWVVERVLDAAPAARPERTRSRRLPLTRRFREHVRGCKVPGFRVDLDNRGARRNGHVVTWRAVLYRGGGKTLQQDQIGLPEALRLLRASASETAARRFTRAVERDLRRIPDASTLQRIRAEREHGRVTPYVVLERIADVVARHFGSDESARRNGGLVPPRIAAALVATAFACEVANAHPERPAVRISTDRS